jgi:hypothetical protein
VQGAFYVLTGAWPLVHMPSFLAVTGDKTDLWLVRMVGALAVVIGAALLVAGRQRRLTPEVVVLAVGATASFIAIDLLYAWRFSPAYLVDAGVEAVLAGLLLLGLRAGRAGA